MGSLASGARRDAVRDFTAVTIGAPPHARFLETKNDRDIYGPRVPSPVTAKVDGVVRRPDFHRPRDSIPKFFTARLRCKRDDGIEYKQEGVKLNPEFYARI